MNMALVRYQPQTLTEMIEVGRILAASGFFADVESEAQAVAKILAGQEAGFGPMASLMGIHMVHGRPELGANLLAASIKRSGKYNYRVLRLSAQEAALRFFERQDDKWEPIGDSAMTMQEVVSRQLHMEWDKKEGKMKEKATWKKYPQNMLFAAALRNGVKWYAPDVTSGPFAFADEFDEPAGVFDVIEADYAAETPPVIIEEPSPVTAAESPDNGQAAPAVHGEPRHLTPDETKRVFAHAKAKKLTKEQTLEALECDQMSDFQAFDPEAVAVLMINDYERLLNEPPATPKGETTEQPALPLDDDAEETKATAVSSYEEGA